MGGEFQMIHRVPGSKALVESVARYLRGGRAIIKADLYHHALAVAVDPRDRARADEAFYLAMGDTKKAEKARSIYAKEN